MRPSTNSTQTLLLTFPIAMFLAGGAALLAWRVVGDGFWYRAAYSAMLVGAAVGLLAGVVAVRNLAAMLRGNRARLAPLIQDGALLTMTGLIGGAGLVMYLSGGFVLPLLMTAAGLAAPLAAGALGWRLLQVPDIGITRSRPMLLSLKGGRS